MFSSPPNFGVPISTLLKKMQQKKHQKKKKKAANVVNKKKKKTSKKQRYAQILKSYSVNFDNKLFEE